MAEFLKPCRAKEMKQCILVEREVDTSSEDSCILVDKSNLSPRKAGLIQLSRTLSNTSNQNDSEREIQIPHTFLEHTYNTPTFCDICDGMLVGLWSQGYKCSSCGMNTHRGQGAGEHDNCRAEALVRPCPGRKKDAQKNEEEVKLGDTIKKIRELAKDPNFLKEVTSQLDKDIKSKASRVILQIAVDDERTKNLKRLKVMVLDVVSKIDAITRNGEFYVMMFLLSIQALITVIQTIISFGLFLVVLAPKYGFLSKSSFQLAAMHDSTVTCSLHTILSIVSGTSYYISCMFMHKRLIIERFLKEALKINPEPDIGISVTHGAALCKYLSSRTFISSVISSLLSCYFWHYAQPPIWEAATMHPSGHIIIPVFIFTCCSGFVAFLSLTNSDRETKLIDDQCDEVETTKNQKLER